MTILSQITGLFFKKISRFLIKKQQIKKFKFLLMNKLYTFKLIILFI